MNTRARRWFMMPAILFVAAGLLKGGADLTPLGYAALFATLAFSVHQVWRPTVPGWRLAFASFGLLAAGTAVFDLTAAMGRGLPPLPARIVMVVLFAAQFGVPLWLLWLAKPRPHPNAGRPSGAEASDRARSATAPERPPSHRWSGARRLARIARY